jgi:hypothetical protein
MGSRSAGWASSGLGTDTSSPAQQIRIWTRKTNLLFSSLAQKANSRIAADLSCSDWPSSLPGLQRVEGPHHRHQKQADGAYIIQVSALKSEKARQNKAMSRRYVLMAVCTSTCWW